jgi:hypothetical protein
MTQLSNANLLDENVGGNLKNERLQKTADFAQNPNMERQVAQNNETVNPQMPPQVNPQMQMPPQMNPQMQMPPQMQQGQAKGVERTKVEEEYVPNNLPVKDYGKKQVNNDAEEKKILGMKPALFYTLLGVAVIAGGYFAYTKFIKKGKGSGKSLDSGSGSATPTPTPTPSITEVPIT